MEHKGDLHPQVVVEDPADGKILDFYYMPERAHLEVTEGDVITPGAPWSPRRLAKLRVRRTSPVVCLV